MRLTAALAGFLLLVAASGITTSAQTQATPFVAGEILVKFKPGVDARARANVHRAEGGTRLAEIQRTSVHRVRVSAGDEAAAIARYTRNPNVLYAEPNFVRRIPLGESAATPALPRDYYFGQQWGFHNTGQAFYCLPSFGTDFCFYNGLPDADIDAPEAWATTTGASTVTVGVIDTGIDYTQPDLAANYAGGWDFVSSDNDPMDDQGHGTHVAGTIAAAMNNPTGSPAQEEGVVGVAPHARIRAYKVCGADGTCSDFAVEQAIAMAVADGANVINMSLGDPAYSQSLNDAVQTAWNAGVVIVAGAGNNGDTNFFYPAALDNVISVGAFDEDHLRASFSTYGTWVDIAAPGSNIISTYPASMCDASTTPGDTGCYQWLSGTSMATPHVSGAAALLWSRPDVTSNAQIVDILLGSADPIGVGAQRLDSWTIHGGLNVGAAMTYSSTRPAANAGMDQTLVDNDHDGAELVTLDGSASSDPNGPIVSFEWTEGGTPIATGQTTAVSMPVGVHTITLTVTDNDGETATDTVAVTIYASAPVSVSASTVQATEAGPADGIFTVSRLGDTSAPLTVYYTLGGTAIAGVDYVSLPGNVTIAAGSSTATIAVTPIDDNVYESDESVILTIAADAAYSVGSPSDATVTIVSDDPPPDLVVSSAVAPSTAGADTDIVITDTTKNQGTGIAVASQTGLYLSTNTTFDAADTLLGSRAVPTLAPGASDVVTTTIHLPSTIATGSYYVLAKADWDNGVEESVETNNVRASGAIKIGPDLIVSALTVPASVAAGAAFNASDTTKNQGGGSAGESTTRFYLSSNSVLDASDVIIGNRPAAALAPGAFATVSTSLTVPAGTPAGTYYVIAQADAATVVPETLEINNTRSGAIKVGPDLIVSALSAPATAAAGATIVVTDTTKNQGAGDASASATAFYLSVNATVGSGDVLLGSRAVGEIAAGATATASTTLQIPEGTAPGVYYVIGRADVGNVVAETVETNNDRASAAVKIGGDLTLTAFTSPTAAVAGNAVTVSDTTKNQGAAVVEASSTGFYLSVNAAHDAADVFLGARSVGVLDAFASSSASTQLIIPPGTAPGTYYLIAVADWQEAIVETTETNNVRVGSTLKIGPDMVVVTVTAPASAVAGTSITATTTIKNQGAEGAPASTTNFYLSTNASLDASDALLGTRAVPPLAAGVSDSGSAVLPIPAPTAAGTYYLIVKADGGNAVTESLETNNTYSKIITISAAP